MAEPNLQEIHDLLIKVAFEAGRMILSAKPNTVDSGTKKNSADLVTETDKAVETMVSTTLRKSYPSYDFIGEETYYPGQRLSDTPTFIVDPIDGTTNFVHGFPHVCISLGLAVSKKPVVGVIYNPFLDELYTAISGHGAYLTKYNQLPSEHHKKMKLPLKEPEKFTGLDKCLIAAEWGSEREGNNFETKKEVFGRLAEEKGRGGAMVHSLRCLGSAALNLAAVSCGTMDAFWEGGCWAWDVCAGWCVLEEAGGKMVGGNPGDWGCEVEGRVYLAIRGGEGWRETVEEFWRCVGERRLIYEV